MPINCRRQKKFTYQKKKKKKGRYKKFNALEDKEVSINQSFQESHKLRKIEVLKSYSILYCEFLPAIFLYNSTIINLYFLEPLRICIKKKKKIILCI